MAKNELPNMLRNFSNQWPERKERAIERRATMPKQREWCFGIIGLSRKATTPFEIKDVGILRAVVEPPGEIELARTLDNKGFMSSVARYSHGLTYELAVNHCDDEKHNTLAWWVMSAIRVRSLVDILVPVVANMSWSVINGAPDDSVKVSFLEDVPQARHFGNRRMVCDDDLEWVQRHFLVFAELLEKAPFRLAVEALTTHQHHANLRMCAASLWAGLEALFNIDRELAFRLSVYIAALMEPRGAQRITLYREMKKRYSVRSIAVHGGQLEDDALVGHIRDVRAMLSGVLCKLVETGRVPSNNELDEILLS